MSRATLLIHRCAGAVIALALAAAGAAAQVGQRCDFVFTNIPGVTRLNAVRLPSGQFNSFLGGGVVAHCAGQDNRLVADSAEHYQDRGLLYLIGNVHYTEPRAKVDALRMTYFVGEERLHAEGNVFATFANGTTMRGPAADYYRVTPTRPKERLIATGRPQLSLAERDSAGRLAPPVIVLANQITMDGDSLVYAGGSVDITRTDVTARSDSAFLDGSQQVVYLIGKPRVVGRGRRPFTLEGDVVTLFSPNRKLERAVAAPHGHATSADIELFSDTVDMRIAEDRLERAYAWGASRARATSPEREITADSLDVILPRQQLREVRAVGDAYATSIPDTARVISSERDWLRGDTIVARFDSLPAADTVSRPRARELDAVGSAASFHQVPGEGGNKTDPNLNYVIGDTIVVSLREGEVQTVTVSGNAHGVYLERGEPEPATPARARPKPPPPILPAIPRR